MKGCVQWNPVYGREIFTSSGIAGKRHRLISRKALNPLTYRASSLRPGYTDIKFNSSEWKFHMRLSIPLLSRRGGGGGGGQLMFVASKGRVAVSCLF